MKRILRNSFAFLLALLMVFQCGEGALAYAAEEIDKRINPAEYIELSVPEKFRDGENWFFIPESGYMTSEKSTEKLFIPIQRAGDLGGEAEITLKVIDLSARHDVNYTVEIYKEDIDPEIIFGAEAIVDLIRNADGMEEVETAEDENELGEMIYEYGGAELVDGEGNTVATVTATKLDENGNPIVPEDEEADAADAVYAGAEDTVPGTPGEVEESAWTEGGDASAASGTAALRSARDRYTGTVSDRQELEGGDPLTGLGLSTMTEEEYDRSMAEATQESYPGKEYRLTFAPGEAAKFLVVTPMYSDAAEGDTQIMLMLKDPSEGFAIGEDVNPVSVTILDEDEPEPVHIDMAAETVIAENGVAVITVNRTGRVNAIKGVNIASWDGSAKKGEDYSGIGAKLYFGMGINTRTVELPVGHASEEKDFYVTITALADEEITLATTHVIIPPAENAGGDGELMDQSAGEKRTGKKLTKDPINVRDGWFGGGDGSRFMSDTTFFLSTHINKEENVGYGLNTAKYGSAYDGVYLEYDGFLNWCDAQFMLVRWTSDTAFTRAHTNEFDDGGWTWNHWLYCCWNSIKAPQKITIEEQNIDNEGAAGTDSYVNMHMNGLYLIKRQFNISVEDAEVRPLIGMDNETVLKDCEAVFLDGGTNSTGTYWTEDSFSITAKTNTPLTLVGLEAQVGNEWVRFADIDGKSSSVVVVLNADTINKLDGMNAIRWSKNGSLNGDSYMGSITVRPVFDYIDVTVEVQADTYGTLNHSLQPTLLWDFNQDNAASARMGKYAASDVKFQGEADAGDHDYYVFTATGRDPRVSLDEGADSVDSIQWVKLRVYNRCQAPKLELFAATDGRISGDSTVQIELNTKAEWTDYVFNIKEANKTTVGDSANLWKGKISWMRLDPMAAADGISKSGDAVYIDYIAFFPDEASARSYAGPGASGSIFTYHLGDVPDLSLMVNAAGQSMDMQPSGVYYELRTQGSTGAVINHDTLGLTNGHKDFKLRGESSGGKTVDRPYYMMRPVFTSDKNNLVVTVSDADYAKLDTAKGIFAEGGNADIVHENGQYRIIVARDILVNDTYAVTACTKDGQSIPRWTTYDGKTYSGETFYLITNPLPEENVIVLTVPDSQKITWMTLSGTVASSTFNLNTDRSAFDVIAAEGAYVAFGEYGAWTDEEGEFKLPAVRACNDTLIRFLVDYNGISSIKEARVPGKNSRTYDAETLAGGSVKAVAAKAGLVLVENFSTSSAHFESAYADQDGKLLGAVDALSMNGKKLKVEITVAGGEYVLNNRIFTEKVKDVTVFFMDQATGEIHGRYSSNTTPSKESPARWGFVPDGSGGGVFTLEIYQFNPEHPEEWTYGDVLMAQLTTDKQTVTTFFTGEKEMRYDAVSTGYAVIADPDFEPQTFDYDLDDVAALLGVEPKTDEDGKLLDDKRASFGSFPYIGEITAAIHVFSKVVSSSTASAEMDMLMDDLESMGEDAEDFGISDGGGGGGEVKNATLNILVKFDETFYGGVRFMLGVIVSYGGGAGYSHQKNPFKTAGTVKAAMGHADYTGDLPGELLSKTNKKIGAMGDGIHGNSYGGPYFKIAAYVGIYIDFGYIELQNTKDGKVEKSHDAVFMGAGGFIGFSGAVGYTWPFMVGPIPMYVNVEAGISVTFFLGASADPNKTLAEYEKLEDFKNKDEVHAQDYGFNFEFHGRLYASGTIGVGFQKVLGVRITVELAFESGYSNNVTDWFPDLFDTGWGYVTEATFTGTIDLLITSIDVYSATWPLPLADGFMYYFQEVRRANKCISYVLKGVSDEHGTAEDRAAAIQKCKELGDLVDAYTADVETLKDKTYALKKWAYDHDIITWTTANAIEMNKQGGIVGTVMNAVLQDDSGGGIAYHTNPHVSSRWVAADGQLSAAYSPVNTADIVSDAYAQPSSKIVSIGGNKFLVVFLDDSPDRSAMQAATLKWTVYDAASDTWTVPQVVQNDSTADSRPNLVDAGDKVILSWSSAAEEKYDALRYTVAKECGVYTVDPDTDIYTITDEAVVQLALENDPARVLGIFDIFTAEFSKESLTFGPITQLTDDAYYDDCPQGVYDAVTGDFILLYTKTAQDTEAYATEGDKLLDLVGASPDPEKTYSVVMYMLYNNQTDAEDTFGNTHEPGWARDYYFPNETSLSLDKQAAELAAWGGQRFLPSVVVTKDGQYADPPITDLTVASGYNGLASYAYTVDMDFDMNTSEDRALYFQTYDFKTHSTYYPVRVGGSVTELKERYDATVRGFVTESVTRQVEVGTPRLIRNGGSTFLFWREDGQSLKYLNVSELMNAKVAGTAGDHDGVSTELKEGGDCDAYYWKYAVRPNGTFAADAVTGETYTPKAMTVDFGSLLTKSEIEITDYEVITDERDNLYVVWTDTVTSNQTDPDTGEKRSVTAQEIYASALVRQTEKTVSGTRENGEAFTVTTQTARWSKPYRLTRSNEFNDGLALALDDDGGLIIVHNRYSKLTAKSEQEVVTLIEQGKIGLTQDRDGKYYAASLSYNSPVTLSVTRCDKIGSLEATYFEFSDAKPVANETISVTAAIENVGLIDAEGCEIEFYEYKNGVQMRKIGKTYTSDETIQVNTAKKVSFEWTVPADGPEGYSIQAVIKEKRAGGGWYADVKSYSDTFNAVPVFLPVIDGVVQEGDQFRVKYHVDNRGNAPAQAGTSVAIFLEGLYGDLNSDRYGNVEDNVLYSADISSRLPAKTVSADQETGKGKVMNSVFSDEQFVTIPASVFRFCGYDAIRLVVLDAEGNILEESDQMLVSMDSPMNLLMNGGEALVLSTGESKDAAIAYNSTVFIEESNILYNVADPEIAAVDADGTLTGLSVGTTTLTATLLPGGRETSVKVTVSGGQPEPEPYVPEVSPSAAPEETDSVPLTVEDLEAATGDTVTVELENGTVKLNVEELKAAAEGEDVTVTVIQNPDGSTSFDVTAEGEPLDMTIKVELPAAGDGQVLVLVHPDGSEEIVKKSLVEGDTTYGEIPAGATVKVIDNGKAFPDVAEDAWYVEAVDFVSSHELFQGTDRGFEPDTPMNRAMLATVLYRLEDAAAVGVNPFPDVAEGTWYTDAVTWASAAGIVNGTDKGFEPMEPVTREQIAAMLYRYATYLGLDTQDRAGLEGYADGGKTSAWAVNAMEWAVSVGLFKGDDNGNLNPGGNATRAEVATLLQRMVGIIVK